MSLHFFNKINFALAIFVASIITLMVTSCSTQIDERWSVAMAQSEMRRNPELWKSDDSKKLKWSYKHGIVGMAFLDLYNQYGGDEFRNYAVRYADTMVFDNGSIYGYKAEDYNLNSLNNGNLLFLVYQLNNNPKYHLAIELLRSQLKSQPRTTEGGYWHQQLFPNQMWLDDAYMVAPFYAHYNKLIGDSAGFSDVANQFILMHHQLFDPQCKLLNHAWDQNKTQPWANPETGQSPTVWSQGLGYYTMALVDVLDDFPVDHPQRKQLVSIFTDMMASVVKYQDISSGVWYQVTDSSGQEGNYFESTGSCMFVYSLIKGVRLGYLDHQYLSAASKGYDGIINKFISVDDCGLVSVSDGCNGAGLGGKPYRDGTFNYYISEPKRLNDSKAVGTFIMASLEYERLNTLGETD